MNLKGFSTIGVVLIILLSIVAIGLFLSITFKSIRNATAEEKAKCLGIDLKLVQCVGFTGGTKLPSSNIPLLENTIYAVVQREFGGGQIENLRFHVIYDTGENEILEPVSLSIPGFNFATEYPNFVEYSSVDVALHPSIVQIPATLSVSAVVGKSKTICEPTAEPISCVVYVTP